MNSPSQKTAHSTQKTASLGSLLSALYAGPPQDLSWRKEIAGGVTTFLTMAYILFVNPSILSTEGSGLSFSGTLTATVLLSFSMTLLMGLYAKLPFAIAPGMGLNAFFVFSIIFGQKVPWTTALGIVTWAGVIFFLTSITPLRTAIADAIPEGLRHSISVGIGFFLTFIGFKNAGWIVADPHTFVKAAPLSAPAVIAALGVLVAVAMMKWKPALAFLTSILVCSILAFLIGATTLPSAWTSAPDFHSVLGKLDLAGALRPEYLPAVFAVFFTDLFDSISTLVGVSQAAGLQTSTQTPRLKQGLIVDSLATLTAGIFGTSAGTAYIESASGIQAGARTGWASVVTAVCFLPCLFLAPVASMVPAFATAPVLVLVGALMFGSVRKLSFHKMEESIPQFVTALMIPLSFSITRGILWGFSAHFLCFLLARRHRELSWTFILLGLLSVVLIAVDLGG